MHSQELRIALLPDLPQYLLRRRQFTPAPIGLDLGAGLSYQALPVLWLLAPHQTLVFVYRDDHHARLAAPLNDAAEDGEGAQDVGQLVVAEAVEMRVESVQSARRRARRALSPLRRSERRTRRQREQGCPRTRRGQGGDDRRTQSPLRQPAGRIRQTCRRPDRRPLCGDRR